MTTNAARAETLVRALRAAIERDLSLVDELCSDDVTVWTPAFAARSADELRAELARGDDAFSDLDLTVSPMDVGGDYACVEWSVTMTHSGDLELAGGSVVEPTGLRVTVYGMTVAEFRDERICSLRQYWDELSVLEQLGLWGDAA
jgi:ketosteroid isomerase-like protein